MLASLGSAVGPPVRPQPFQLSRQPASPTPRTVAAKRLRQWGAMMSESESVLPRLVRHTRALPAAGRSQTGLKVCSLCGVVWSREVPGRICRIVLLELQHAHHAWQSVPDRIAVSLQVYSLAGVVRPFLCIRRCSLLWAFPMKAGWVAPI